MYIVGHCRVGALQHPGLYPLDAGSTPGVLCITGVLWGVRSKTAAAENVCSSSSLLVLVDTRVFCGGMWQQGWASLP